MWDLIVSVPDHCLSFYFEHNVKKRIVSSGSISSNFASKTKSVHI